MTHPFFLKRTAADASFDNLPAGLLRAMLDSIVRRLVETDGPIPTARRLQLLADICAVEVVLPIDHWRTSPKPTPSAPEPRRFYRTAFFGAYALGLLVGFIVGATL